MNRINKYKLIHQAVAPLDDSGHRESLIATFQTIGSDSPVIFHIACVHLKSKTHFANLRINQGRRLLDFFEKYLHSFNKSHIERKNEVDPVFIVGDFNAETYEEVINIVSSWSPHCYGTGQKLVSAYKRTNGGKEPEFTTWKIRKGPRSGDYNEAKHTIDYIWYLSPRAKLKGVFSIPSSETIGHQALPSSSFPSDHMSLIADFII
ncbi:unnamed protein product [Protopolystoma xenopodis]|uniref:Endonuclease/exonuclease/phosphatase domain-containing protein n=1 Tax=Protopolystoma xenopodis TaxID=117903 RepID=A0A3S5BM01_9PLAT|nr:unnamed protein product [Protopolystoma xenopodis]